MILQDPITLSALARLLGCSFEGNGKAVITGINEIHKVQQGDVTFVDHPKYYKRALNSAASFIIINEHITPPEGKGVIFSEDPFRTYNDAVATFNPFTPLTKAVSSIANIGFETIIQPGAVIGDDVIIGDNCLIHPNVTIYNGVEIGNNVIIHANTVIGSDAFYFKKRMNRKLHHDKLLTCGSVIIHDYVEVGAGCTIDKGVSGDTIVGEGTKLDNQVHIGHGTVIGKNCLIAAQVGIAGKTTIEDNVTLWGQVGVNKDLRIGENTVVYAQSGVPSSLPSNGVYFGSPAQDAKQYIKQINVQKRLPEYWSEIKLLKDKDNEEMA